MYQHFLMKKKWCENIRSESIIINIWLIELAWERVNLVHMKYMICNTFCIVEVGPDGLVVLKYLSNCQF